MTDLLWSISGMVLTGETEVLGEKHYTALVVGEWMGMERWWNDTRSEDHTSELQTRTKIW
jgi:hypothetical protein